jgi:hypothetical protein
MHVASTSPLAGSPLGARGYWTPPAGDPDGQLVALLRSQAPLRRVVAAIAGRLVATRAWERLGYARSADYAAERAGCSARQLQELARVDAALAALPQIDAALSSGQLLWTKGRLLCRVATPEDEGRWLEAASGLSAQALSREVRAVDGRALENGGADPPPDEEDPETQRRETLQLRCAWGVKGKWFHARQLARRVAGENLPPWRCAEYMAAEVLSAIGLEVEIEGDEQGEAEARAEPEASAAAELSEAPGLAHGAHGHGGGEALLSHRPATSEWAVSSPRSAEATRPCASLPPAPAFLAPLVADLASADAFELDARLRRALQLEQRQLARLAPLLLAVASERSFRDLGYRGLDAYARERLGMAPSKARALLRLERIAQIAPALGEAWRAGRLSWTQAEALAPLLRLEHAQPCEHAQPWQAAWVERARRVSVRRLRDDVDWAITTENLDPAALPALPVGLQTGAQPRVSGGRDRLFFTAPRDVARLFRAVLATLQRHLERGSGRPSSQEEAFEALLDHALEAWGAHQPLPEKYRVFAQSPHRVSLGGGLGRAGQPHDAVRLASPAPHSREARALYGPGARPAALCPGPAPGPAAARELRIGGFRLGGLRLGSIGSIRSIGRARHGRLVGSGI